MYSQYKNIHSYICKKKKKKELHSVPLKNDLVKYTTINGNNGSYDNFQITYPHLTKIQYAKCKKE